MKWRALPCLALALLACGGDRSGTPKDGPGPGPAVTADGGAPGAEVVVDPLAERPWEVLSAAGETLLGNVFYADAVQNEQIMPWAVDGRAVIDRLVYPTLGNPNLYVRDDARDELVLVVRIEPDAITHLAPRDEAIAGSKLRTFVTVDDDQNGFAFFLGTHAARPKTDGVPDPVVPGADVFRIRPKAALLSPEPADLPDALRRRRTVRFVFDAAALNGVPAGLYDARFEVRKAGKVYANVYETQYNAVRVFDHASDEYTALDVTDTQISTAPVYATYTADKLDEFVSTVNASTEAEVRNAAFIAFNGDLHNGGSPESLRARVVSQTYASEAKRVVGALKKLTLPIFLTPGNHDGYVAMGHVPSAIVAVDDQLGDSLKRTIDEQNQRAWPDYTWDAFAAYLADTAATPGGRHVDLVSGGFTQRPGLSFTDAFLEVPRAQRNMVLYDGFYQWQKTYGPLSSSWTFGKNRWVSLNTFELRQHRRSGWGMYTVNYGGSMTPAQLDWLDRDLARAKTASEDVVLLMHHDPRGGHEGIDHGYYFPQLEYQSIAQSTINYLLGEVFEPANCKDPSANLSQEDRDGCLHDGLQEWMAPDELDAGKNSGIELMTRIKANPHIRTMLVGHTHNHSMEVLREGDALTTSVVLDAAPRDLAILRLTSLADLTSQKYGTASMFGWSIVHVTRQLGAPTVNRLTYFIHTPSGGFDEITTVDVDRTKHLDARGPANPVDQLFDW